jgi:hypothetical protein
VVPGHSVPLLTDSLAVAATDSVAHIADATFRVVSVPLTVSDGSTLGSLYLATNLDRRFAQQLGELAHAQIAIVTTGEVVASTLAPESEAIFERAVPVLDGAGGTLDLHGESNAYRRLFVVGVRLLRADIHRRCRPRRRSRDHQHAVLHCDRGHGPGAPREHLDRAPAQRTDQTTLLHSTGWRRCVSSTRRFR